MQILTPKSTLNVYRGTITGLLVSAVDGTAFIDAANASVTALADGAHQIEIYDSTGKMLRGVLKAAGSAEGLGDELFVLSFSDPSGWDLESAGWTVAGGNLTATNVPFEYNAGQPNTFMTGLALYKVVWTISGYTDGSVRMENYGGWFGPGRGALGTFTDYVMQIKDPPVGNQDNLVFGCRTAGTDLVINACSAKQVLTPSTSGATIVSAVGGTTYNFNYKQTGFAYNEASYKVQIRKLR